MKIIGYLMLGVGGALCAAIAQGGWELGAVLIGGMLLMTGQTFILTDD